MVIFGIYGYKGVAYNMPPKKESQKVDADHSATHDNEKNRRGACNLKPIYGYFSGFWVIIQSQ